MLPTNTLQSDRRFSFIKKYLNNPYSPIENGDLGYTGEVIVQLKDFVVELVYADLITWHDPGKYGRADLVIPVRLRPRNGGEAAKYELIIRNTPAIHKIQFDSGRPPHLQHWDPVPELIERPDLPNSTNLWSIPVFIGDFNGNGLADRAKILRVDNGRQRLGALIRFEHVEINTGFGLVSESNVPAAIRDARLGYIAAYAQTLFQGISVPPPPVDGHFFFTLRSEAIDSGEIRALHAVTLNSVQYSSHFLSLSQQSVAGEYQLNSNEYRAARALLSAGLKAERREAVMGAESAAPLATTFRETNQFVASALQNHPELDFSILKRGTGNAAGAQSYVPDIALYNAGLLFGQEGARQTIREFKNTQHSLDLYLLAPNPLSKLSATSTEPEILEALSQLRQNVSAASKAGGVADFYSQYPAIWRTILNSPVFVPQRVDRNFVPIEAHVPRDAVLPEDKIREQLRRMDAEWVSAIDGTEQFVVNGGRVVGMALAFLNLMVMRSSPTYIKDMEDRDTAASYIDNSADAYASLATSLAGIARRQGVAQLPAGEFFMASLTSGYRELVSYLALDHGAVRFVAGYKEGRADALNEIKTILKRQIPDLEGVQSVLELTSVISDFVRRQQLEISRLTGIVEDLRGTVKKLNAALDEATALLKELRQTNQKLQRDLDAALDLIRQLERTGEAIEDLAKAGTGFLIAGPIGALACVLFC